MNKKVRLSSVCNIITGKLDANAAIEKGKYPFFTCAPAPLAIDNYAYDGDVILIAGNNAGGNFHVSRFKGKFNAYQRTYILTSKSEDQDLDYIFYSLKLELQNLKKKSQGSQTKFLTLPLLSNLEIEKLAPLTEAKIASFLKNLDAKITLNNKINAELEAMAKTLYDYWFVQFDFPDENGKPYKSSGGKMVWNEELKRKIPADWKSGILSDIGDILGGSTPSKEKPELFSSDGIPWITPKDLSLNVGNKFITRGEIDVSPAGQRSAALKIMPKGTILLSSRAPIGYMAIARGPLTTNQGFKSFVPREGFTSPFVYYALKRSLPTIINHASGSTFKEISGGTLSLVRICLPPANLIRKYTNSVEAIFSRQNQLELETQILIELRDWLLPMLMNGQVKVE